VLSVEQLEATSGYLTGPDDHVFMSATGGPLDDNLVDQRVRPRRTAAAEMRRRIGCGEASSARCPSPTPDNKPRHEHLELREQFLAEDTAALEDREVVVAAREQEVTPLYRARFVALGAFLAVSGDLLLRVVA